MRSTSPKHSHLKLVASLAAVFAGWLLVLADSAGPSYLRTPATTTGTIAITFEEGYDYDCYPMVNVSAPVHRLTLADVSDGTIYADAECIDAIDCLSRLSFEGYYYLCSIVDDGSSDAGTDYPHGEGQSVSLCTGDESTDYDAGTDANTDGSADAPLYVLTFRDAYAQDMCTTSQADEPATLIVTAVTAAGEVSTVVFSQVRQEPQGYGCGG